jgi:hypothetical protein
VSRRAFGGAGWRSSIDLDSSWSMNGISDKEAGSPARPALARSLFDRYFARRIVYPTELPSIMRKHIYTGAMGRVWATLISGVLFVFFGEAIGLSPAQFGLMGGIS